MIDNNEDNIQLKNNDDEMFNLIKKLDNQFEENKKKSILNLPSYDIDLDLNFDVDFKTEINLKPPEEKKDLIYIENKVENKKEEILKNQNIEENKKPDKKEEDININIKNNNEENGELNNSNEDDEDKTISVNNIDENIENEDENIKNENEQIKNENEQIKNENEKIRNENEQIQKEEEKEEENKKIETEEPWDLITSMKGKEEEKNNNLNINLNNGNNDNNINENEENNKKENYSEDDKSNTDKNNLINNNNNDDNINEQKENEKKSKEDKINKKNSDSLYESADEIGDEFEDGNDQNKNENNNINININNIEEKENSKDKIKTGLDLNESNADNNKENLDNINNNENNEINNINKSHSAESVEAKLNSEKINPDDKKEEISLSNIIQENNNKNKEEEKEENEDPVKRGGNEISSGLDISEKQEIVSKQSTKSKNSKKEQLKNKNQNINIQQVPSSIEIQQAPNASANETKQEKKEENIKARKSGDYSLDEDKKKLKAILNKVKDFRKEKIDENKENLAKLPVINLDFNYKEKTLDDLIPSLLKKIEENEPSKEVEKRKLNFMAHNYFEGSVSTSSLLQIIPECKVNHTELMEKILNEKGLKNIPKISEEENCEKKIFGEEDNGNAVNPKKIGEVENIENFLYKYHLENNEEIALKSYKYFPYWRSIENDGNSFFRVAMFAVFENFIIKNLGNKLKQIISEITCDKFVQIYKEHNINYKIPFYIFGTILYLLDNNKIEEAYSLLIKSYSLKDNSFDELLIIYLRYICFDYVEEILELCKDEEILKKCDTKIGPDDMNVNKELIKTMNVEPDFFNICLMTYLFDINILIYYLDRDLSKPKEGLVKLIDEDFPDLPFISLGYFFSSYHRIYWRNWVNEEPIIKKHFSNDNYQMKKLIHEFKSNKLCKKCKNSEYIVFLEKKIMVCKNCLDDYINDISNKRKEALFKDNYIGKEYYSRSMKLNEEQNLNDFEFIELKEDYNMINYLQQKLSVQCSQCKNFFTKKNLNNLKCKCLLCDKCLNDMIIQMTKGKKILNVYEKSKLYKMKCSICGFNFSYEDAIDHLKDIKQSDKNNAIRRMAEYVSTLCFICTKKVREKNDNVSNSDNNTDKDDEEKEKEKYNEIKKYKIIKLKKEGERNKGIDYIDNEHVICFDCLEKNRINNDVLDLSGSSDEDKDDSDNKYFINFTKGFCFCRLCNKKHFLLDKNAKDGACCKTALCSLI